MESDDEHPERPGGKILAEGRRRYEAGDLADAGPLALRALELRPPGSDPAARSEALQLAAEVAYGRGRYVEARDLAAEAAELRAAEGEEEQAETENLRGILDVAMGDAPSGLARLEAAHRVRERVLGEDHPDTLESLNNVGVALGRVDRMPEAMAAHREALRRCERAFDHPHRQLAVSLNGLAVKLDRTPDGREEAYALSTRALEAAEAALGPEHPYVAMLVANLATNRLNAKAYEVARPLVARAVDLHERRVGPTSPGTATALQTAAELALADGRLADARALLDRALAIRLDAFGARDPRTIGVAKRLLTPLGGLMQTDPSVRPDAVAVYEAVRLLDPASVPAGAFANRPPDPVAAERALRAYLARVADRVPPADPELRRTLDRARSSLLAADTNFMAGDLDAAAVAADDAIAQLERARGPEHLDLVEPLRRSSAIERARDRADVALRLDGRALEILATSYGESHPFVLREMSRLAIQAGHEYGHAASRPGLERLRRILGEGEKDSPAARLRGTIDHVLARIPAAGDVDTVGLSERRRAAAETVTPLASELLPDLGSVPWARLADGPRQGASVAAEIRLLLSEDPRVAHDAVTRLLAQLIRPGGTQPGPGPAHPRPSTEPIARAGIGRAAGPAIPFLLRLLRDTRVAARAPIVGVVTVLLAAAIEERRAAGRSRLPAPPEVTAVLAHEPAIARSLSDLRRSEPSLVTELGWASRVLEAAGRGGAVDGGSGSDDGGSGSRLN